MLFLRVSEWIRIHKSKIFFRFVFYDWSDHFQKEILLVIGHSASSDWPWYVYQASTRSLNQNINASIICWNLQEWTFLPLKCAAGGRDAIIILLLGIRMELDRGTLRLNAEFRAPTSGFNGDTWKKYRENKRGLSVRSSSGDSGGRRPILTSEIWTPVSCYSRIRERRNTSHFICVSYYTYSWENIQSSAEVKQVRNELSLTPNRNGESTWWTSLLYYLCKLRSSSKV